MSDYLDIHALIDGELDADSSATLRQRLTDDPALKAEYDSVQLIKSSLSTHCQGLHCEETWAQCKSRLEAIEKTDRVNSFVGRYAWQFCGAFVVMVAMAGAMSRMNGGGNSVDPSQVANIAGIAVSPIQGGDRYGFQSFLRGTWTLESANRGMFEGRELSVYDLRDGIGAFRVVVIPDVEKLDGACHREVQGINCYSWIDQNTQYIIYGERNHAELEAIAKRITGQP